MTLPCNGVREEPVSQKESFRLQLMKKITFILTTLPTQKKMRLVPWNFTIFLLIKEPIEYSSGLGIIIVVNDDR